LTGTAFALLSGAQVSPFGLVTRIALAVLLLAVFLVAHFPARRAARAEPAESQHELLVACSWRTASSALRKRMAATGGYVAE
jgi:type IV secretory pathway TrbD component